ncbi:receptor-like protein EIX2 [Heracleum sosnowskyi]|uniref:Receptor-like protein EIX2 n=1 Tax=Heracleum sosnowskyi TaxID=360622 RepID=A0AAD8M883_9APIA|nr:receptor-like protein EIX2 [Heracleum sosnowskyi]
MIDGKHPIRLVLVLIFLLCLNTSLLYSESIYKDGNLLRCSESERNALFAFKQGVVSGAHRHDVLDSWKKEEEDCCKWNGVGCDNRTGHVTYLHLSYMFSPDPIDWYVVSISNSLLDLPYLNYLDLSKNLLKEIPKFIGSLTNLVHLDLSDTLIGEGSLPNQIGNLSNLQSLNLSSLYYLNLSNSYFTRVIPHELGNLSKLQYLSLSSYDFAGPVPKFIGSLYSLKYLDLSHCIFEGVFPQELGKLCKLQHLDLAYPCYETDGNNFDWLFNLTSLTHLDLSGNSINQKIPSISVMYLNNCNILSLTSTLSNFSSTISSLHLQENYITSSIFNWLSHVNGNLVVLDLSYNVLEGKLSQSLSHMTALTYLDLSGNQLYGVLPKSIYNLSSLQVADFSFNSFTGNLEDFLSGHFALLQELFLSENQFTGSVPDFTLLPFLRELEVSSNHLNGYLSSDLKHHSELQFLDLSNNLLKGSLPNFTGFSSLRFLHLSNNEFSGSLSDFSGCSSLQELYLDKNQLTEWRTLSIGLLASLEVLDLSMNSIRSTISEAHLSNLSSLKRLRTSSNSLTFEISSEWLPSFQLWELSLASCRLGPKFPNWIQNQRNIYHLDISYSQISDTMPIWFGNLSSSMELLNLSSNKIRGKFPFIPGFFQEIDLSSNYFDGPIPAVVAFYSKLNLSKNRFSGTLLFLSLVEGSVLSFLDVSHNQLVGSLPDTWMLFRKLVFLNLGYNNISGRIPMSIGQLVSLQTLILRNNKLYGELPASLRNCSSLGFLDFGLNKLSGKIPSWIGNDLPYVYALILKSNRFNGSLPNAICHLRNLHFLDLSINKISGTIPLCFGNFSAMSQTRTEVREHNYSAINSTEGYFVDNVMARWKGQEYEYGRNFAYLKMIDLSINEFTGEIPLGITRLLELKGLNLSGNRFYGKVPPEIGQLKLLECLDLSTNKFSGEIPQSMSGLNFLAFLNLSNNNFSGKIPYGTQLQGFSTSTYEGNSGLCGRPLTNICPGDESAAHIRPPSRNEVDGDTMEYKRWLCIGGVLGFSTSFWGIIGTLVLNRRWRNAYYLSLNNLKERFYVAMVVRTGRLLRKV